MLTVGSDFHTNDDPRRRGRWAIELAVCGALLLESLLPIRAFRLAVDPADVLILALVVTSGYAVIRGGHSLLSAWLRRLGGVWLARALNVVAVGGVAMGGMWHGLPHYSLTAACVLGVSSVAFLSWFAPPGVSRWRRITGGLALTALFAFVLLMVDLNVLSLYPRHVSVLATIVGITWLAGTLSILPAMPARDARRLLSLGGVAATLCLALAPATSGRVAGYLRRQSELGTLLAPIAWARGLGPSTYLTWGNDICPTVPARPMMIVGRPNDHNVLLISIDTLRRDLYLRPDQDLADVYPNLASVAKDGCRYQNVRSVGASTHLAMPALYNGTLGWTAIERPLLSALAERAQLHARAFGGLWQISNYSGLPGGGGDASKDSNTTRMIAELGLATGEGRSWMLVAHYLDLHLPRKAELLRQFSGDLRPVYVRKLAALDADLGRLFAAIKARGEWDRTAVIITADHGEELNERGYSEHAFHLYETVLDVPLIVRVPGLPCLDQQTPATVLDIVPMLASGLGLEAQSFAIQGRWPPVHTDPEYAFSTVGGPFMSIIDGNQKVIVDGRYGDTEVYDLAADPQEKHDLGGELTPAIAARLAQIPIPWNPLVPLGQRFRHADGTEYDVCPGKVSPQPPREATVQAVPVSSPLGPHASRLE